MALVISYEQEVLEALENKYGDDTYVVKSYKLLSGNLFADSERYEVNSLMYEMLIFSFKNGYLTVRFVAKNNHKSNWVEFISIDKISVKD